MSCYRVKDPFKFSALVTLDALRDAFDPTGQCEIKPKAKLYCVPTTKNVDEFIVDKAMQTPDDLPGQTLTNDVLCYKVKCPKESVPDEDVSDQLGTRGLSKFKRQLLCTPAFKTAPTCSAPDPPQCTMGDPCSDGICSTSRGSCAYQTDCPLDPLEECCCSGTCI